MKSENRKLQESLLKAIEKGRFQECFEIIRANQKQKGILASALSYKGEEVTPLELAEKVREGVDKSDKDAMARATMIVQMMVKLAADARANVVAKAKPVVLTGHEKIIQKKEDANNSADRIDNSKKKTLRLWPGPDGKDGGAKPTR